MVACSPVEDRYRGTPAYTQSVTTVTVMTTDYRGSLQGCESLSGDERWCDEPGYREYKCDKGRRPCELRTLYSSPNVSPATLIDSARHPVWGLNSRHIERASIIRWQSICEVAPPMFLLARNPRAAEQRDTPSIKPARDYPAPKRSIIPISPEVVATKRLDQAQRSIGPLPIMGRTLPITMEERD